MDPIAEEFAHVSVYNYAENSPISNNDLYGLQATFYTLQLERRFGSSGYKNKTAEQRQEERAEEAEVVIGGLAAALEEVVPGVGEVRSLREGDVGGAVLGMLPLGGLIKRFTKGAKAARLAKNKAKGKAAEAVAEKQLKDAGFEISGRQVTVKTSQGARRYDFVAKKDDEIVNVEVKSSNARRTKAQRLKDEEVAKKGGKYVGKNASDELKKRGVKPTKTIEWQVKDEDIKYK